MNGVGGGMSTLTTTPAAVSMHDFNKRWRSASINVTHFDVTIERRIGMKYDVMSGVNFYRIGMESTLSEQHQQIAKNIFPKDGME